MDGGLALCLLVTLGFGAFVIWGRTAAGRQVLRQTVGEPVPAPRKPTRKAAASSQRSNSTGKAAVASAHPAIRKKPSANATAPGTKVAQPKKRAGAKEPNEGAKK